MQELERTYLIKEFPADIARLPHKEILDIYLPAKSSHPDLRIRKSGERYETTRKRPQEDDSSDQLETTIPLSADEYRELAQIPGKRVHKIRCLFKEKGVQHEIDVFQDALSGLVLVDVEFKTAKAKDAFVMPSWCLAEVTQEEFIAGGMLCGKRYADIEKDLARLGYRKIAL